MRVLAMPNLEKKQMVYNINPLISDFLMCCGEGEEGGRGGGGLGGNYIGSNILSLLFL